MALPPPNEKKTDWSAFEDEALMLSVLAVRRKKRDEQSTADDRQSDNEEDDDDDWDEISEAVPGKTAVQCLQRYMRHLNKKSSFSKPVKDEIERKDSQSGSLSGNEEEKSTAVSINVQI